MIEKKYHYIETPYMPIRAKGCKKWSTRFRFSRLAYARAIC